MPIVGQILDPRRWQWVGRRNGRINHNTGGTDNLRVTAPGGTGIGGVVIRGFVAADYDDDPLTAPARFSVVTRDDGRWPAEAEVDAGITYVLTFDAGGAYAMANREVTVPETT